MVQLANTNSLAYKYKSWSSIQYNLLSHNNLFASKAFLVIGDVYFTFFPLRSL